MGSLDKLVERLMEQYTSAVRLRDAAAFMRLYEPKARIFDAWGVWEYNDSARWKTAIDGWFASSPGETFKVLFDDVQISGSTELAVVHAIVTYASISPEGEQLRAMQNRITWALRVSSHQLRVVHEHTSAPIGFDDQKAILQRQSKP